jgi:tetrahydromethanopterin S-methyltransferase subunit C
MGGLAWRGRIVKGVDAVRQLRGRNLSHIGCTLGLVAGLSLGLLLALVALRISPSVNAAFAAFAGATVALGVVGYVLGVAATRRFANPGDPGR